MEKFDRYFRFSNYRRFDRFGGWDTPTFGRDDPGYDFKPLLVSNPFTSTSYHYDRSLTLYTALLVWLRQEAAENAQ